jgi:hypothetical protein
MRGEPIPLEWPAGFFQEKGMKQVTVLLAAILVWVTVPAATAAESGINKPVKKAGHAEEKISPPAEGYKLDFQELFGCKPMGEYGHMPMPGPVAGESRLGGMQPVQEHDPAQ